MKKAFFYIVFFVTFLSVFTSCTTDGYDKDMEASVVQSDETTSDSTNPIVIPKRD